MSPSPVPPSGSMEEIVALAHAFAAAREATETLADDIKALQRKALSGRLRALRSRVAEQAIAEEALRAAIQARPDLFVRPRTVTVDGIRFGLRKQPGAAELARIGVTVAAASSDLDRFVAALLDDATPADAA